MSADDKEQEEATREKKPKMSKKKKGAIVAGIFLVLIVIIAGVVYYMGHRYYTKTNYMTDDEVQALIEKQKEEQQEKETEEETTVEEEVDPELLEAQQNMAQYASTEPITTDGNVYNIMLVGLDTTDKGWIVVFLPGTRQSGAQQLRRKGPAHANAGKTFAHPGVELAQRATPPRNSRTSQ